MNTYIASLTDANLAEAIWWRTTSIAEARELLVNRGAWQSAPDGGGQILLSENAAVRVYEDDPPFRADDDLAARVADSMPRMTFSIGPRGGIRRDANW